jgi:flagellar hook-basal body complex protein FliE
MTMSTLPISSMRTEVVSPEVGIARSGPAAGAEAPSGGPDFADALAGALGGAATAEKASEAASTRFAAGDPSAGIHETLIAAEKATIALRYAVTLKNKVIEAYRELMNTPV